MTTKQYRIKIKLAHLGVAYGFITENDLKQIKRKLKRTLKLLKQTQAQQRKQQKDPTLYGNS